MHQTLKTLTMTGTVAAVAASAVLMTATSQPAAPLPTTGPTALAATMSPLPSQDVPPCSNTNNGKKGKKKHKIPKQTQHGNSRNCNPEY